MSYVRSFESLSSNLVKPSVISIAGGNDNEVLACAHTSLQAGYARHVIITGPKRDIRQRLSEINADLSLFEILDTKTPAASAELAISEVKNGNADILMKGHIDSAIFLKCILDKQSGIRNSSVLSNLTLFELDTYHKLLGITDNAIVPNPILKDKLAFIENSKPLYTALRVNPVKVGIVAAAEKLSDALPSTHDAVAIRTACERQELKGFLVDGPFGYDACISKEAAKSKNLDHSSVAGDPDLIVFHDLETANAVGKAIKFHGRAKSGGLLLGASVPVTFNSRSDNAERRINSLILACITSFAGSY
jgi:phosphate butyryltransferase